jgi:hypothetical protein
MHLAWHGDDQSFLEYLARTLTQGQEIKEDKAFVVKQNPLALVISVGHVFDESEPKTCASGRVAEQTFIKKTFMPPTKLSQKNLSSHWTLPAC